MLFVIRLQTTAHHRVGRFNKKTQARRPAKTTHTNKTCSGKAELIMRYIVAFALVFNTFLVFSQDQDTKQPLDTVYMTSIQMKEISVGQKVLSLEAKTVQKYRPQLTDVLDFETPIYFKENGLGMVSSASFRGTTAQQTAVLWNGININSQFLGQTDFNTVSTFGYDEINVRPGGGSSQFGTGSIGGSISLDNGFSFQDQKSLQAHTSYGSFDTRDIGVKGSFSNSEFSINAGASYFDSDNDYKFANSDRKNENGQFHNTSVFLNAAYRFNSQHQIKAFTSFTDGLRHFSILEATQSKSKYKDENLRLLLEYNIKLQNFFTTSKFAFLNEDYTYFPELGTNNDLSTGKAQTAIYKNEFGYKPTNNLQLQGHFQYQHTTGNGSNYENTKRQILTYGLFGKHQVNSKFVYQISLSADQSKAYKSPLLYAIGAEYQVNSWYNIGLNSSKNYRIPTFNDLYWPNAGNPDLGPETSLQHEITNTFKFDDLSFKLTAYYNDIDDLIVWLPVSGDIWKPINTKAVDIKGVEIEANYTKQFKAHKFRGTLGYGYTESRDKDSRKQLIYVPYHKLVFGLHYNYKKIEASVNNKYTGLTYTQSDNNKNTALQSYLLTNLDVGVTLDPQATLKLGARIKNLWNTEYETVLYKPMPLRNYQIYLTLNL